MPNNIEIVPNMPAGVVRASLFNFDINGDQLKPEHKEFLRTDVLPILRRPNTLGWIIGGASHHGTEAHNLALSRYRARAVQGFLIHDLHVPESQLLAYWVGEACANPDIEEYAHDREVVVMAGPRPPPTPPPTPPTPPTPPPTTALPTNTAFRLKVCSGLSGSFSASYGVAWDRLIIQIWDVSHRLTCVYQYGGVGYSRGTLISGTLEGPWNDFRTTGPLSVVEFAGGAAFHATGAGSATINALSMNGLPRHIQTVPNPVPVGTGFTLGVGTSQTVGWLWRAPDMPQPYWERRGRRPISPWARPPRR